MPGSARVGALLELDEPLRKPLGPLLRAVERFHCTLGEVREDYWLGRVWRGVIWGVRI